MKQIKEGNGCNRFRISYVWGSIILKSCQIVDRFGAQCSLLPLSADPIVSLEHSITEWQWRLKPKLKQGGDNRTMGRKFTVPMDYIVLTAVSARWQTKRAFRRDLELLWKPLKTCLNMIVLPLWPNGNKKLVFSHIQN